MTGFWHGQKSFLQTQVHPQSEVRFSGDFRTLSSVQTQVRNCPFVFQLFARFDLHLGNPAAQIRNV
jgi:hypothetical protein